jgi:hypothetical protein
MRWLRFFLTALLGLLLFFDVVVAYRLWWYGIPKNLRIIGEGSAARLSIERIRFTALDWTVVALLIIVHVALSYAMWRCWRPSRIKS